MEAVEAELFPTKSYTEIKQGLPASTLKAVRGAYGGGSENYIVETKIYENHLRDARYGEVEIAPTLTSQMGTGGGNVPLKIEKVVLNRGEAFVRRLTPLECERLQGLPDNWTEGGSDAKRYKAIGNGMAQPCADFVIEKLVEVLKERG